MSAIALVTGASGGLGQAVASELRREGWTVALVGRSLERLHTMEGVEALCIEADVSTPDGAQTALTQCQQHIGLPTALAHCAGTTLLSPLHRTTPEQYRSCLSANLDSAFFMLGAFVEGLRQAREPGAAVLVSSVVARIGVANHEAIATPRRAWKDWCGRQRRPMRRPASVSTRLRRGLWIRPLWRGLSAMRPVALARRGNIPCPALAIRRIWRG